MKLTLDEQELLEDFVRGDTIKILWKECESAMTLINDSVLKYNLTAANQQDLIILKARAEGASQLLAALKQRLDKSRFPNK